MEPQIIDLSVPCSNETDGVSITRQQNLPVYLGHECYAYDIAIKSHTGTYFETSSHLFRDGRDTDEVGLEDLVLPGVCLTVKTDKPCICADDLESACDSIRPGSALLINTGPHTDRYFSRDAAQWMVRRKVKLMGSSSRLYDCGFDNPTGFFVELFQSGIPIIANLANLDKLPQSGFTLVSLPLPITGVCTVPCRVIAMMREV
jgi:kynurenine formamidase